VPSSAGCDRIGIATKGRDSGNALVALRVRAAVGLANAVLTGPGFDDLGPARTEEEVIALASR
jgi:hypothetical protein